MDKGTKKIYVQDLGLDPSTTIYEVLQLFPELMGRDAQNLDTYSVSLDDQDVGSSKQNLLMQLTVSDVNCVEVCDNASAAYAQNGATGSINIVSASLREGVSGYALCDISTEASARLAGSVGYLTDRLTVRATVNAEYQRSDRSMVDEYFADDHLIRNDDFFARSRGVNQGAKLNIDYRPSSADAFSLRLWENYNFSQDYAEEESHQFAWLTATTASFNQYESDINTHRLTLFAQAKYEHLFRDKHKLGLMLNYNYGGLRSLSNTLSYTNGMDSCFRDVWQRLLPHQINTDVYFDGKLMQTDRHTMSLKLGMQNTYSATGSSMIDSTYRTSFPKSDTTFASAWGFNMSPYLEYNYAFGQWVVFNLGGRFRHEQIGNGNLSHTYNSYMLNFFLTSTPVEGHTFRLGALRNFLSPTFESETGCSYTGNFRYVYNGNFGEHRLNTEAALQYTLVHRYDTDDRHNVWQANWSAFWSYRWVSIALAFSLFDNQQYREAGIFDYKGYYNIRLTPMFRLPKSWQLSATVLYSSDQITQYVTFGRYVYTALRLGKQLGNWSFHGEVTDLAHYRTTDVQVGESMGSQIRLCTTGYPYPFTFRLGLQYRF